MSVINAENVGNLGLQTMFRRKITVQARRMNGAFQVDTSRGRQDCKDGYVAVDMEGRPGAIPKDQFEQAFAADVAEALRQVPTDALINEVNRRYREMQSMTGGDPDAGFGPEHTIDLNSF